MIRSRCLYSLIVPCTVLFPMATPALAQGERRFYVGAELGTLLSSAVTMTGDSNDRASICDEFISPLYASVPGCTDVARDVGDSWSVPFDGAGGVAMSAVMGCRLHGMAGRGLRDAPTPEQVHFGARRSGGQCRQAATNCSWRRGQPTLMVYTMASDGVPRFLSTRVLQGGPIFSQPVRAKSTFPRSSATDIQFADPVGASIRVSPDTSR